MVISQLYFYYSKVFRAALLKMKGLLGGFIGDVNVSL